jgi:hypothetical protein
MSELPTQEPNQGTELAIIRFDHYIALKQDVSLDKKTKTQKTKKYVAIMLDDGFAYSSFYKDDIDEKVGSLYEHIKAGEYKICPAIDYDPMDSLSDKRYVVIEQNYDYMADLVLVITDSSKNNILHKFELQLNDTGSLTGEYIKGLKREFSDEYEITVTHRD